MAALPPTPAPTVPAPSGANSPMIVGPSIGTGVQNYSGQQGQTATGASTSTNQYTPGQQQLQNQAGQSLLGFMQSGSVPGNLTAPPQIINAYERDFNDFVTPGLATQYGAGSPQIGEQQSLGLANLLANTYQTGVGNYLAGEGLAGQLGYTPVGAGATSQAADQASTNAQQINGQSLLSYILNNIPYVAGVASNMVNMP